MTYTAKELADLGRTIDAEAVELRRWRRAHCLTIAEMSAVLGVNECCLSRVERGEQRLPKRWRALAAALYDRWSDVDLPEQAARRKARRDRERRRGG